MPKIKVIHFVNDMGRGGLEQVVMMLVQSLNPEKFAVEVWCMSDDFHEVADQLKAEGKTVRVLGIRSYYNPWNILKLAALIKRHKPDIIHSHIYFASTISRIAAKLAGVPVVITHMHNVYLHFKKRNLWIDRFLSRVSDRIICCSRAVQDFVVQNERIHPDKTMVIHNGIDMDRFDTPFDGKKLRQSLNIQEEDFVIIMVASLMEKKGHKYLFDALSKLIKDDLSIKCLVVGYGTPEEEAAVRGHAKQFNLIELPSNKQNSKSPDSIDNDSGRFGVGKEKLNNHHVMFLGLREDVPDLLRISHLFVLPSLTEGLPLCIMEAMAVGLPVVATDVGGVKEVLEHNVTGVMVEPKNSEALYAAMKRLKDKPDLAKQLGSNALRVSRAKFSSQEMVKNIERVYLELIAQNNHRKNPV